MVDHVVHVDTDIVLMGLVDEVLEVFLRAVALLNCGVILYVVAVIALGGMDRRKPQAGYTKLVKVIQALSDTVKVSIAVSVRILEGEDIYLVGDAGEFLGRVKIRVVLPFSAVFRLSFRLMSPGRSC